MRALSFGLGISGLLVEGWRAPVPGYSSVNGEA